MDDEILAIDDVRVRADGLAARLEQYQPGDKIAVLVARRDRLTRSTSRSAPILAARGARTATNATAEQKARFEMLMNGR